jgi:threonine/homoserine efflux transporter RhtA
LLPASAAIIGATVLRQIPTSLELAGVTLVAGGVALQQQH